MKHHPFTPREVQCDECNRWFLKVNNRQHRCAECQKEYDNDYAANHYRKNIKRYRSQMQDGKRRFLVFVLGYREPGKWPDECLDDAIDFRNSIFHNEDFDFSLKKGCFPSGLVVKRNGRVRIVQGNQLVMLN